MKLNAIALALTVVNVVLLANSAIGWQVAASPQVVRAERFELIDQNGVLRALISVGPSDNAGLIVYDEGGTYRVSLTANKTNGALIINMDEQGLRGILAVGPGRYKTYLGLKDHDGQMNLSTVETLRWKQN